MPGAPAAVTTFVTARYRVQKHDKADEARTRVVAALDRLEAELGGRDYLVGDAFTVADLTAAALFYLLVSPLRRRGCRRRPTSSSASERR